MDHNKPTQEDIDKTLEELDKTPAEEEKDKDTSVAASIEDTEEKPSEPAKEEDTSEDDTEEEATEEDAPEEQPKEPAKEEDKGKDNLPDDKERLKESAREANKLFRNNAKLNQALAEADELPDPTIEELREEYDDWDDMTAAEQRLSKESFINKRFRSVVKAAAQEQYKVDQWVDKVDEFTEDPQTFIDHPELDSKEKIKRFKEFATDDKKLVGSDFGLLVTSFLYKESKEAKPKSKGAMFPKGGGATHETPKPKDDRLTLEESNKLMTSNFDEWKRLLKAGKIREM